MREILTPLLILASITPINARAEDIPDTRTVTGGVYTATNYEKENSIVAYRQLSDGTLQMIGKIGTGGKGTGPEELFGYPYDPKSGATFADGYDPLASAYGVWRSADKKNVLVANAGDGTVSSLRVQDDLSLKLVNVVRAGDIRPLTIASYKNLVYVASLGKKTEDPGDGNVKGYTIDGNGKLTEMPGSVRTLTGRPSSAEFTPDGKFLLVTEIISGNIHSFSVADNGLLSEKPVSSITSPKATKERFIALPVGTKIVAGKNGNNTLLVSETRFVAAPGKYYPSSPQHREKYPFLPLYEGQAGSMTSYNIDPNGKLTMVSADVIAGSSYWVGQQAVCWVTVSPDGKYAWTTNPLTSSLSTYAIADNGSIKLVDEIAYQDGGYNEYLLDVDLSADGHFLNAISGSTGRTWVFKINHKTGELALVNGYEGGPLIHSYGLVTIPAHPK